MSPSPSIKRLVIHAGDPKTGSSSIQQVLFDGAWSAPGSSLAYPGVLNAIPLADALRGELPPPRARRQIAQSAEWLAAQTADVAVFSAEHFAFVEPDTLREALPRLLGETGRQVTVLAYVRPHLPRLLSTFAQRVKTRGLELDFEAFCRKTVAGRQFHYAPRFLGWRGVFGEGFVLRAMTRGELFRGDVVADFLQAVLGSEDVTVHATAAVNESPTLDHLAALSLVQSGLKAAGIERVLRHALCTALAQRLGQIPRDRAGPRPGIPAALLPWLQEAYRADAEALDTAFFPGRSPLGDELERARGVEEDQSIRPEARLAPEVRAGLTRAAQGLAAALAADPASWLRQFRQKNRRHGQVEESAGALAVDGLLDEAAALLG